MMIVKTTKILAQALALVGLVVSFLVIVFTGRVLSKLRSRNIDDIVYVYYYVNTLLAIFYAILSATLLALSA